MEKYIQEQPRDFLAVATPGAGKTTFALTLASWLLHHHVVQQVTVVAPTEHLKKQWAEAAVRVGIKLDPEYSAGPLGREYDGSPSPTPVSACAPCCTATASSSARRW